MLGGAVWGNTEAAKKNDYFIGSHNIRTSEFYWKVIIKGDGETIAWYIPNTTAALTRNLDKYLIKPVQLELKTKVPLPEVPKAWRIRKPKTSCELPEGCEAN